jgi:hypothetical protein
MSHPLARHARHLAAPGRVAVSGLRVLAVTNPAGAAERIRRILATVHATMTGDVDLDLRLLLAEALNRQHDHTGALHAANRAVHATTVRRPFDSARKTIGFGIVADAAVCLGLPDAAAACHRYRNQILAHDANPHRLLVADALTAITTYRGQAWRALHQLQATHPAAAGGPAAAMLRQAVTATASRPGGRGRHASDPMAPLPGAILSPDPARPDPDYLIHRITTIRAAGLR